ncbi:MAG: metal-dependent transcriptional regulator [Candidatus Odinarchaeia archaeon]
MELTPRLAECLIEIKRFEESRKIASNKRLSTKLGLHPSTITELFHKLDRKGLVSYDHHHGVRLTHVGEKLADTLLRKHRLLEKVLVDFLGFEPEQACKSTSYFDKYIPDNVIDSLCAKLNHPKTCPCGKPIVKGENCIR